MHTPRLKIVHFMVLAALVAVCLAVWRWSLGERTVAAALALIVFPPVALVILLWVNPVRRVLAAPPMNAEERIAELERALESPRVPDFNADARARFHLMQLYKVRQRYEDAIAQGRKLLKLRLVHDFEAQVREQIAVCLDLLGRDDEADAALEEADETLDNRPRSASGWFVQGRLLEKKHRYADAVDAYERALARFSPGNSADRDVTLTALMLASYNAGRPDEVARWAEQIVSLKSSSPRLLIAHRMAAIACANLGRLDDSERHRQRAYELALEAGDPLQIADCLLGLADLRRLRGDYATAEQLCGDAEALGSSPPRLAFMCRAAIRHDQGQLDEALACMERARQVGVLASAYEEQRAQAVLLVWAAVYKAELGRVDDAWGDLRAAEPALRDDPKLGLTLQAARVLLFGAGGDRVRTVEAAESVTERLNDISRASHALVDCLELLGRGLFDVCEYDRSARCWERLLAGTYPPMSGPVAWYHLGECRQHLGDHAGARSAFDYAVAAGIDSRYFRRARQRLDELSGDAVHVG